MASTSAPLTLPVLPLDDEVVLPGMVVPLDLSDTEVRAAVEAARAAAVGTQKPQVLLVPRVDGSVRGGRHPRHRRAGRPARRRRAGGARARRAPGPDRRREPAAPVPRSGWRRPAVPRVRVRPATGGSRELARSTRRSRPVAAASAARFQFVDRCGGHQIAAASAELADNTG